MPIGPPTDPQWPYYYQYPPQHVCRCAHLCPVCNGRGTVNETVYLDVPDLDIQVKCRSCRGRGYITIGQWD